MKAKELRDIGGDELEQKEMVAKKALFDLNSQRKMGNVDKPSLFRKNKRDIARILTIKREKEIADGRNVSKKK